MKISFKSFKMIQQYVYENSDIFLMLTMGEKNFEKLSEYPNSFWLPHQSYRLKP
jgi:hypothetical protein